MTFEIKPCSRDTFRATSEQYADIKEDNFSRTFIAKADMIGAWDQCFGLFDGEELMGAQITTISKRLPRIANLQLLHTFSQFRGKGVGRILSNQSLANAHADKAEYWRVSSEASAKHFYDSVGVKFQGMQKSGCFLSIFKIGGPMFTQAIYESDKVIEAAVHRKGKGGCVVVF